MTLPCGIALRANNSILVESVFHGAKDAKEEDPKKFSLRSLRLCSGQAWRDKEKIGYKDDSPLWNSV